MTRVGLQIHYDTGEDTTGELSSLNKDSYIYAKEKEKNVTREIGEQGKQVSVNRMKDACLLLQGYYRRLLIVGFKE